MPFPSSTSDVEYTKRLYHALCMSETSLSRWFDMLSEDVKHPLFFNHTACQCSRPVARGGRGGRTTPPLGQKLGKGPLLETNLLHIQLVQSIEEYLFHCFFDEIMHQSASKSISVFKIYWGRTPRTPFLGGGSTNFSCSTQRGTKRSTFSNLRPPPLEILATGLYRWKVVS